MDKFWKWMEEKGYAKDKGAVYALLWEGREFPAMMKQMLIGYMIEYLIDKHIRWSLDEGTPFEYWYGILEKYITGKVSQSWDDEGHLEIPEK